MFRAIRQAAASLQACETGMKDVQRILLTTLENTEQREALAERVAALELGHAKWQAEAEALILKADAVYKNARNAEERTRSNQKRADERSEGSTEGEEAIREAYDELYGVSDGDAEGGENGGVQGVRPHMEVDGGAQTPRNRRLMAKFR